MLQMAKTFLGRIVLDIGMRFAHDLTGLRSTLAILCACSAFFFVNGCAKSSRVSSPPALRVGTHQTGIASWYGDPYHGRRAANGEVFDMNELTAAHREWPFETMVRVHNLDNNREVTVRITDRGPFVKGRIIDLSRDAADEIHMLGPGLAKVRLTVVGSAPSRSSERYTVQAGSFTERKKAEQLRKRLEKFSAARVVISGGDHPVYRVFVGSESSKEKAEKLAARVRSEVPQAFVTRDQTR